MIPRVAAIADLDDDDGRLVEKGMNTDYVMVSKEASLGIAELSCTVSEMDSCVHQCVLPEVRSFTANAGTKVAVLLGINRCGSFLLLSAPHSIFSI